MTKIKGYVTQIIKPEELEEHYIGRLESYLAQNKKYLVAVETIKYHNMNLVERMIYAIKLRISDFYWHPSFGAKPEEFVMFLSFDKESLGKLIPEGKTSVGTGDFIMVNAKNHVMKTNLYDVISD